MIFKAIGSPEKSSSSAQPVYVTMCYCLMCISTYQISRLLSLFSFLFMSNSVFSVLSSPK